MRRTRTGSLENARGGPFPHSSAGESPRATERERERDSVRQRRGNYVLILEIAKRERRTKAALAQVPTGGGRNRASGPVRAHRADAVVPAERTERLDSGVTGPAGQL